MNERKVSVTGDKMFRVFDVDMKAPGCSLNTQAEAYAHDMEAVEVTEGGPTVLYCRRGCGLVQKLEVPA